MLKYNKINSKEFYFCYLETAREFIYILQYIIRLK